MGQIKIRSSNGEVVILYLIDYGECLNVCAIFKNDDGIDQEIHHMGGAFVEPIGSQSLQGD